MLFCSTAHSKREEEGDEALDKADNLVAAQLGLAVHAVDKGDGDLRDGRGKRRKRRSGMRKHVV